MLQATRVFKDEVTRQNRMYWLSGYSFTRTEAMLGAIASCGRAESDPRVDAVWPSTVEGEARIVTIPVSKLSAIISETRQTILTNAILHICSAFEALLDGYFMIGLLYRPDLGTKTKQHSAFSKMPMSAAALNALYKAAADDVAHAGTRLKGNFTSRVAALCNRFGLTQPSNVKILDSFYFKRHIIAHDQSLSLSSDPLANYKDMIASRLTLTETEWKVMLGAFLEVAKSIDASLSLSIVADSSLAIAAWKESETPCTLGKLRSTIQANWGIASTLSALEQVATAIGCKVTKERIARRRTVSR